MVEAVKETQQDLEVVHDDADDALLKSNEDSAQRSGEVVEAEERTIQRYKDAVTNPLSGIRAHCVECVGGHVRDIAKCTANNPKVYVCSLYQFRTGTNTLDIRTTDEYKAKMKAKQLEKENE